jgi:hypothetical protein
MKLIRANAPGALQNVDGYGRIVLADSGFAEDSRVATNDEVFEIRKAQIISTTLILL